MVCRHNCGGIYFIQAHYCDADCKVTNVFEALGCNAKDREYVEEIQSAVTDIEADNSSPEDLQVFIKKLAIGDFKNTMKR
ncbi:hypothetical protein VTP01DRAFT_1779 [Rhizomucor pusillus]|uniref:uncharacterized protein n=1 Tax=Rhizomucor pusillus TaxID=4840 RepID=UPI0037438D5A